MLTSEQIQKYLERIGLPQGVELTREGLDRLQFAHQCTVPFETLDMQGCTEPPCLDMDYLFRKVVEEKRGGYCFQLNKLFEALLKAVGFEAYPVLCRSVRGREGRMPINHRGIMVALDGEYLFVDVGFGGPLPAGSLVLEADVEQIIRGEVFIMRQIDACWWAVDRVTRAKADFFDDAVAERRQTEVEVCIARVEEQDFVALNREFSQPGVLFRETRLANLRTETGHKSLKNDVLTIRENGEKTVFELTPANYAATVEEHFGFSWS